MGSGKGTAAVAVSASLRRRRLSHLAMWTQQPRRCSTSSSTSVKDKFRYRPDELSGRSRKRINMDSETFPTTSFSVQLSPDSIAPPSALNRDNAVEYLAALRGLHRTLGVTPTASRVRWQAREFLLRGMPNPNSKEIQASWEMTEELACGITVSCAYFELSIVECPYGLKSVEFLQDIWQKRQEQQTSLSTLQMCTCEEAVLLGKVTMAFLELLTNRIMHLQTGDYKVLPQLLCGTLLPAVMRVLQDDALFFSPTGELKREEEENDLAIMQATALTVLLSSLMKAAVTHWARRDRDSEGIVLFGTPAALSRTAESNSHAIEVSVPALSLEKLARVVQHYASRLMSLQVKETALPLLRFFTLTQCVPLFLAPHGDNVQETHVASLVTSITRVLQASLESRTLFVSHQVANITSIYARILSFTPKEPAREKQTDGNAVYVPSASWLTFESIMIGLKRNILYNVESLSPIVVMPHLCECVTVSARKYLFSDFAALLSALAKVFRVVCEQHSHFHPQEQQQQSVRLVKENTTRSRFEKRRTTASVVVTNNVSVDAENALSTSQLPSSLSTGICSVSNDDIAEIEGELEVLLDACVAVMERHLPASYYNRHVRLTRLGGAVSSTSQRDSRDGGSPEVREETGFAPAAVSASEAKKHGGKGRRLKKIASSRELFMIAEGVHSLSWRPFMAFQERLLGLLASEVGQIEATPSEYASLVRLVLRAPPVPPSTIFHSVGDRLKRMIHAEAVTVVSAGKEETEKEMSVVIAPAHARSLQDKPLVLYDACAVVFAFAQKLTKAALPLLHDLIVRCGQRVTSAFELLTDAPRVDATNFAALTMFVASVTFVLHHTKRITREDHALTFIAASRDRAVQILMSKTPEEISDMLTSSFSLRDLAYTCMMLESAHDSQSSTHLLQLRRVLREAYMAYASRCDCMEVAQFLADYIAIPSTHMSYGDSVTAQSEERDSEALLQLSPWMITALQLQKRLASNTRLLLVMFLPFLEGNSEDVARILDVTRLYCRTFATLVTTLRLMHNANAELLQEKAVLEVVLRKVAQLTRRTARPLELFQFFELYGDCPQVVSACLSELSSEAKCFEATNAFVPIVQINAAVRSVRRLQLREMRQRWFAAMMPLIISAVSLSREPLDVVLELTEYIGKDDPALLQSVLKSSASLQMIHETFSYTLSGDVLLRLLLMLQSVNASHPTVRRLHKASRQMLQRCTLNIPLQQLAQAMLLPSVEGTTLGRRLKKLFLLRVKSLLGDTRSREFRRKDMSVKILPEKDTFSTAERHSHWDESLNRLDLEHWLALLHMSHVGEPSSHRLLMTLKQQTDKVAHRKGGRHTASASVNGENTLPLSDAAGEEGSDRRFRSLELFYAFSDHTILCLRQSLGAFHFIMFVTELLRHASYLSADAASVQENTSHDCRWMYDGSLSPLSDERLRPFVRLAVCLVEEMSSDLGGFLRREQEQRRQSQHCEGNIASTERKEEKKEITLDVKAVLEFLNVLNTYDPLSREQRLLLLSPSMPQLSTSQSLSLSSDAPNVFDDVMQIPHRHLYRILLQVPQHWGKVTPTETPVDMLQVRLQNISSLFDYCSAPTEFDSLFGTPAISAEAHRCMSDIFSTDRPLITDVWLPLPAVQSQQRRMDMSVKMQLFEVLMRCLVRDGESLAATRARLAVLGPRDLACVAQTSLCSDFGDRIEGDVDSKPKTEAWRCSRKAVAISAVELLTDMLQSAKAEDIHDIVMVLLPPSSSVALRHSSDKGKGKLSNASIYEEVAEVRRFLVHVAVVMGNDTERFPLSLLYSILLRLHEPHRLIAPAAAQMMLTNLHAADDTVEQQQQPEIEEAEEEETAGGEHLVEETFSRLSKKRCYTAAVALLRSVVASSSSL